MSFPRLNPLVASSYPKLEVLKMSCTDFHNLITHHLHPLLWEPQIPFSSIKVLALSSFIKSTYHNLKFDNNLWVYLFNISLTSLWVH